MQNVYVTDCLKIFSCRKIKELVRINKLSAEYLKLQYFKILKVICT